MHLVNDLLLLFQAVYRLTLCHLFIFVQNLTARVKRCPGQYTSHGRPDPILHRQLTRRFTAVHHAGTALLPDRIQSDHAGDTLLPQSALLVPLLIQLLQAAPLVEEVKLGLDVAVDERWDPRKHRLAQELLVFE